MSKFDGMTNAIDNWQSGLRDGFPLGIAYFAVSFAFGGYAATNNITIFDSFIISLTNVTSAGQYEGVKMIVGCSSLIEVAFYELLINIRYLIMSCKVSQKYDYDLPLIHRCITSFAITDEIFGVICCQKGKVSPFYTYGIMFMTIPSWCLGTVCGGFSASLLSASLKSALGIVVYSLYFAIIVPPSKHDKTIGSVCVASIVLSILFTYLPYLKIIKPGYSILIITFLVSTIAAILHPVEEDIAKKTADEMIKIHKKAMEVDLYDE